MRPALTLASSSPRRRELLARLGIPFAVADPELDETPRSGEAVEELARRLAAAKAESVAKRADGCVLGADTLVACAGQILGKPADEQAAAAMLALLAGAEHRVVSAVALVHGGRTDVKTVVTRVWFHPLDGATRRRYAASAEARDAAGAYRVQGEAATFVARLVGSYTNVVGLPLAETANLLKRVGVLA